MASSVQSQPTYYETLGVEPTASQEEIRRAFARLMGLFSSRPAAATAQLSVAFATLRNPAKRRGYDQMLRLVPEPKRAGLTVAGNGRAGAGLLGSAWANLPHVTADHSPPTPTQLEPHHEERASEPRLATFIASSLRQPARTTAVPPVIDLEPQAPKLPEPAARPGVAGEHPLTHFPAQESRIAEGLLDWKRVSVIGGGLLAAAGLIGAMTGLSVWDNEPPQPVRSSVSASLPPPTPAAESANVAPPGVKANAEESIAQPIPDRTSVPAVAKPSQAAKPPISATDVQTIDSTATSAEPTATDPATSDPLAPKPAAAAEGAAALPLSNSVIARTIGRIGYACGSVVSTTAVEGAGPGVYSISCSSGQTYRATPVHGRYHFRRSAD
jgi:hypothetical protein